jgi:hypothetical protein
MVFHHFKENLRLPKTTTKRRLVLVVLLPRQPHNGYNLKKLVIGDVIGMPEDHLTINTKKKEIGAT